MPDRRRRMNRVTGWNREMREAIPPCREVRTNEGKSAECTPVFSGREFYKACAEIGPVEGAIETGTAYPNHLQSVGSEHGCGKTLG
jgi:hypothetical protein